MAKVAPLITLSCGATASEAPKFHLLPYGGLLALVERFTIGAIRHEAYGWMRGLADKRPLPPPLTPATEYAIERANHVIHHALKYQAKLLGVIPDDGDDDAAAIAWGGTVLTEAKAALNSLAKSTIEP